MDLQEVGRVWRWVDLCGSEYEQVAGSCETVNKLGAVEDA